jgi:hypothetical protein
VELVASAGPENDKCVFGGVRFQEIDCVHRPRPAGSFVRLGVDVLRTRNGSPFLGEEATIQERTRRMRAERWDDVIARTTTST